MAPLKRWRSVHNYECTNSKFKIELDNALHLQTGKSGMKEELKIVHCDGDKTLPQTPFPYSNQEPIVSDGLTLK